MGHSECPTQSLSLVLRPEFEIGQCYSVSHIATFNLDVVLQYLIMICAKQVKVSRLMTKPTKCFFAPREDSDQPGHPPSLISVFAVRMKKHWVLSYPLRALRRL